MVAIFYPLCDDIISFYIVINILSKMMLLRLIVELIIGTSLLSFL